VTDETIDQPTTNDPRTPVQEPTRRRSRSRGRRAGAAAAPADDTTTDTVDTAESAAAAPTQIRRRRRRGPAATDSDAATGTDVPETGPTEPPAARDAAEADAEPTDTGAEEDAGAEEGPGTGGERIARSRRRRGSRGRGRRGGRAASEGDAEAADDQDAPAAGEDDADKPEGDDRQTPKAANGGGGDTVERDRPARKGDVDRAAPTRLQARQRGGQPGTARGRSGRGRRPLGGIDEETRRAITEGPPRRMLVTVGQERMQIAVLEERTLVEHYVTRRQDTSYVGNIYRGRVQNVLPGMEAAFIDIGKGRNGVLYAGEVNYDEADIDEGELPRIEQTLKQGQSILVQVTKDPMGTKGARLTQHLSIAGRYCVLAPGEGMLGISRKLPDDERERLRKILKDIRPEQFGLIVRTAAEGATREQLQADVARLVRLWEQVEKRAATVKVLEPVYTEPELVIRVIRDIFGPEYTDLVVDSADLAGQIREYLGDVSPELVERVTVYEGEDTLFDAYEVTNQIRRALEKKVWLASGGYLIIEKTEAMWVIDVNTGKFVGKSNLEETVLRNNLEAADEIARQLRLRDMGGIIVIDFVDMLVPANRDEVLKRFKRELARDKTKSRVMDISRLGLVQMTRKNVSQGLTEVFTTKCDVCEGRGARIVEHIVEPRPAKPKTRKAPAAAQAEAADDQAAEQAADDQAAEPEPADEQAAEPQPAEAPPADEQAAEPEPADDQPAEPQPAEA
jgi:Rne/Rng family ribonuclease